jgi:hypothetical protein
MSDNNGKQKVLIEIYVDNQNQLKWSWHGINGVQAEDIFLNCLRGQIRYNTEKAIEEKNKPKIFSPTIGEVMKVTKGN